MKIDLVTLGVTADEWLRKGIEVYANRLKHYTEFSLIEIPLPKSVTSLPASVMVKEEEKLLTKALMNYDLVVLLDERGEEKGSVAFSEYLQRQMNAGCRRMAFVVGGAYGFDPSLRNKAFAAMSLSKMTFSHQMIRILFVEQLYRAFTILKGERYHHE